MSEVRGDRWLRALGGSLLDAVLPPRCLACGGGVDRPGALCGGCWERVHFIAEPMCLRCGRPFDFAVAERTYCGACHQAPPPFERARAVMRYDDASRRLVLAFKHSDRTDGATAYAGWMMRAGGALVREADLILPVPLHRWRLFRRRYNQAALLAQAVSRSAAAPTRTDVLTRTRATPSQGRLTRDQRQRNVRGAFAVAPGKADVIAGRRILLVDDVMTTGATLTACTTTLLRAGAVAVDALVLARVDRPGS